MADILHALFFVLVAGAAFLTLIVLERAYWIRRHRPQAYEIKEVLSNISMGFLYKMVDGAVVAIFVTRFYDDVVQWGLQYTPSNRWLGIAILFVVTDFVFYIHTEVVGRLPRWFEAVFNTPSHHRVHHGSNPGQLDTNFGGVFIIWDRLFGTFVDERDAGTIAYGIAQRQPRTLNPLRLNLDEWFAMWRDVWQRKDLRVLWKPPDWVAPSR